MIQKTYRGNDFVQGIADGATKYLVAIVTFSLENC